ncbi:PEP-CTERM sorting domain-containing protein [Tolypothrix sp. PCC 7910]|uniref:PEP-CTERM sorting domain-containing protein n=1 Tax=Tolypothrix sp. PCC 7910 TaxID=2099387 RepID=UPI001AD62585|nr:PEP-CTERM sorting domain-containing protein [Tolypothrix sp. PCC 7910]
MAFKTIGLGLALTCGTFAVGSTLAPAQAFSLNGTVAVDGTANLGPTKTNPANTQIQWTSSGTVRQATGDFSTLLGNNVTLQNLALSLRSTLTAAGSNYDFSAVPKFIDFGTVTLKGITSSLSFDLSAGSLQRIAKNNSVTINTPEDPGISGFFKFNGQTVARGELSGNRTFNSSGSSGVTTISLATEEVPEPFTILGSVTALGMGVALKKKQIQKLKKEKVTA